MSKKYLASAVLVLALAACSKQEPQPPAAEAPAAAATTQAPAPTQAPSAAKPPRRLGAEDLARIEATGRTGLWADVEQVCAKGPHPRTTLSWNVKASGAQNVLVFLVDKKGQERRFGHGGPVGSRQTGPWLRPGLTFKLRNAKDKSELGSLVIGAKQC